MRRRRKCSECGKPLGGTVGKCYECGGEKVADPPGGESMYEMAWEWKIWALPIDKIKEAHDESRKRNPRVESPEDVSDD